MGRCSASAVIVAAADVLIDALQGLPGLTDLAEDLFRGRRLARTAITQIEPQPDAFPTTD